MQGRKHVAIKLLLNDSPGLLFFSTYTLLILFWAEIYQQARGQATARLRPAFMSANATVYIVQICLLCLCGWPPAHHAAGVRFSAAMSSYFSHAPLLGVHLLRSCHLALFTGYIMRSRAQLLTACHLFGHSAHNH